MNSLQNYQLFSSDRGGMRIEYAKHKMGENTNASIGLLNNNIPNNCNLANNCTNNSGQNQLANSMICNSGGGHVQTTGGNLNHLNNVPCTTQVTSTISNNNHVNHVNTNYVNHKATNNQTNQPINNLNSIGANVSIVNCNSPATPNQQQNNSVVMVATGQENQNGSITITPIISSSNEQMEIVSGIEQCQYMLVTNCSYANRLIFSLSISLI